MVDGATGDATSPEDQAVRGKSDLCGVNRVKQGRLRYVD